MHIILTFVSVASQPWWDIMGTVISYFILSLYCLVVCVGTAGMIYSLIPKRQYTPEQEERMFPRELERLQKRCLKELRQLDSLPEGSKICLKKIGSYFYRHPDRIQSVVVPWLNNLGYRAEKGSTLDFAGGYLWDVACIRVSRR